MATITFGGGSAPSGGFNMGLWNVGFFFTLIDSVFSNIHTATDVEYVGSNQALHATGTFTAYDGDNDPTSGTINTIVYRYDFFTGVPVTMTITGLSISVENFRAWGFAHNSAALESAIFGGNDTFTGTPFVDSIIGYGGNDSITAGAGDDTLGGGDGNDTLDGGDGNDRLVGNVGSDILIGGAGNDDLSAQGGGADQFYGGDGNDVIYAGSGSYIDGGAGVDILYVSLGTATANLDLWATNAGQTMADGTVVRNIEFFTLGSSGTLTVIGGLPATPTYSPTNRIDSVNTLVLDFSSAAYNIGMNPSGFNRNITYGGDLWMQTVLVTNYVVTGTAFNDNLVGADYYGNDVLNGGGGDDTIQGYYGNDTLNGGAGNDYIYADPNGIDIINGGDGVDWLDIAWLGGATVDLSLATQQGSGSDLYTITNIENVRGGFQADTLRGNALANILDGWNGNDILEGRGGADQMIGGPGDDTYYVTETNDQVIELSDEGDDTTYTSVSYFTSPNVETLIATGNAAIDLSGNQLNNLITGNGANNNINGWDGDDTLNGGGGIDVIFGGLGNDTINGGAGQDLLIQYAGSVDSNFNLTLDYTVAGGVGVINGGDINPGDEVDAAYLSYFLETQSVTLTLLAPELTTTVRVGGVARDQLINIESLNVHGGSGNDTLIGIWGATFYGHDGDDTLTVNGGQNYLYGGAGNDTLTGGVGFDELGGGAGADILSGGASFDWITYYDSSAGVSVNLQTNVVSGGDAQGDTISGFEHARGSQWNDTLVGTAALNFLEGLGGNDTLIGGGGEDGLYGGDGNDTLDGGADNDRLLGGLGADTLDAGDGDDELIGGGGADILIGGSGIDTVSYQLQSTGASVTMSLLTGLGTVGDAAGDQLSGIENIIGSQSHDTLIGNAGANVILGSYGSDTIEGGAGADTLNGEDGEDWLSYEGSASGVTINLGNGLALGGDAEGDTFQSFQHVLGSASADAIFGDGALNSLSGRDGDDYLFGGGGNDVIYGEGGNDTIEGGAGADTLNGDAGVNTVSYVSSTGAVLINLGNGQALGGDAQGDIYSNLQFQNVIGSANGDALFASGLVCSLFGGLGVDFLAGGSNNDTIEGGVGGDVMNGNAGVNTLSYASSSSGVTVNISNNTSSGGDAQGDIFLNFQNLIGSGHGDTLTGDAGANIITGGAGADVIIGGDGADTLQGSADDDTIEGGFGADTLDGGAGIDTLSYAGSSGAVLINLGAGQALGNHADGDVISGFENLTGSAHADALFGDHLANALDGGAGADYLYGAAADDSFVFRAGQADGDHIVDFNGAGASLGDALAFYGFGTAGQGATFTQLNATQWQIHSGLDGHNETITFDNSASVHASDYLFA